MSEVVVVTSYIQHETMNDFWGVYRTKDDAINSIKEFMDESNRESNKHDGDEKENWQLIKESDNHQVWEDKNFGHQKEFYFQVWGL